MQKLQVIENSYISFLKEFNRNTKRKQVISLNAEIEDTNFFIDAIEDKLKTNFYAWHLGIKRFAHDLDQAKNELDCYTNLLDKVKKGTITI